MVVFLTRDYVPSRNCRRELTHGWRGEKQLLIVREMDQNHGALDPASLLQEVDEVSRDPRVGQNELSALELLVDGFDEALEWHREKARRRRWWWCWWWCW